MTETTQLPMTGSRGQPLKTALYLAEGERLREVVNAYRAARDVSGVPNGTVDRVTGAEVPAPTPTKPKRLPPLYGPTPIDGYPLNPSPPKEVPDYGNMARLHATRAAQAERRGKKAPLKPIGEPTLRKKGRGRP
jgi:hypothetical protein